jgi:hypothetical protein
MCCEGLGGTSLDFRTPAAGDRLIRAVLQGLGEHIVVQAALRGSFKAVDNAVESIVGLMQCMPACVKADKRACFLCCNAN